jgi:hypothetical protein
MTAAERQRRRRDRIKSSLREIRTEVPTFELRRELLDLIDRYESGSTGKRHSPEEIAEAIKRAGELLSMRRYYREDFDHCRADDETVCCCCDDCQRTKFLLREWPYCSYDEAVAKWESREDAK